MVQHINMYTLSYTYTRIHTHKYIHTYILYFTLDIDVKLISRDKALHPLYATPTCSRRGEQDFRVFYRHSLVYTHTGDRA